uniref:Uncharacterized protein n=1 Tax=Peromyscus maniculatus bairdii TaxID=230844 RepID=A0A8C8UP01_PERMB
VVQLQAVGHGLDSASRPQAGAGFGPRGGHHEAGHAEGPREAEAPHEDAVGAGCAFAHVLEHGSVGFGLGRLSPAPRAPGRSPVLAGRCGPPQPPPQKSPGRRRQHPPRHACTADGRCHLAPPFTPGLAEVDAAMLTTGRRRRA